MKGVPASKMLGIYALTALLRWDKLNNDCKLNSSNYTINSILLSEQQAGQMCNFGRKHQSYLVSALYKIRDDYLG